MVRSEVVFDFIADSRNEPTYNSDMRSVTLLMTGMVWDWQVTPRLWLRMLGPVLGPVGARLERRIWAAARDALQGSDAPEGS
jgi:hypothetical protein